MTKLRLPLAVLVATVFLVLLAETTHHVQARPGPVAFYDGKTLHLSRQLQSTEPFETDPENVSLSNRDAEELDSEEELDVVCIEKGSCDEKRLLTESIDYKDDGPNNPITDPPH